MIKENSIIGVEVECLADGVDFIDDLRTYVKHCNEHDIDDEVNLWGRDGEYMGRMHEHYELSHQEIALQGKIEDIERDLDIIMDNAYFCVYNGLHIHVDKKDINAIEMYNVIEFLMHMNRLERNFDDNENEIKNIYACFGRSLSAEYLGIGSTNKILRAKNRIKDTIIAVRPDLGTVEFRICGPILKPKGIWVRVKQINRVLKGLRPIYTRDVHEVNLPEARLVERAIVNE